MKKWIHALFTPRAPAAAPHAPQDKPGKAVLITDDTRDPQNSDVVGGMRFVATLKVTTPLGILNHHGERFQGPPSETPVYGDPSQGIWIPYTKTWREIGFDIPEFRAGTVASDAGPVRPDEYLPFLVDFRTIFESDSPNEEKLKQMATLGKIAPYRGFWQKLRANRPDFPLSMFFCSLCDLDGVGRVTARNLYDAGFRTKDQVLASTPAVLTKVKGIGPSLAARMLASSS